MTLEQKLYWYRVGYEQCAKGFEEPEHGRMNRPEEACWQAGFWACRAGLPKLEESAPPTCGFGSDVYGRCDLEPEHDGRHNIVKRPELLRRSASETGDLNE